MTYTTTEDFDQGQVVGLTTEDDELKLLEQGGTFPFIWVALSARSTIAKIDTATGEILGEYRTVPQNQTGNVSRTTVGTDGSVWAGNRATGDVIHVGLVEANQCVDRNSNGVIDTSTGYGDVRPWPSLGDPEWASTAEDECILHLVDHVGGDARHVTVDANGDIWVGSYSGNARIFQRIDGATAAIEYTSEQFDCGGYGGLIDGNGVLWSATSGSQLLRWDLNEPVVTEGEVLNPECLNVPNYGLALDGQGWVWASVLSGGQVRKVSPDGDTVLGPFSSGSSSAQGLAVDENDDVWVSSSLFCSSNCTVGHLKNDGTFVGNVATPTGAGSTGVAVDAAGKIWTANINASTATRIDPALGAVGADGVTPIGAVDLTVPLPASGPTVDNPDWPSLPVASPYNYSDMTGRVLLGRTAPQGTWTILQDSGSEGTEWGTVSWNATVPDGASLESAVEVRAAETQVGLGEEQFEPVGECEALADVAEGRFIEVRMTLRPNLDGDSPVVHDVTIRSAEMTEQLGCEADGAAPPSGGSSGTGAARVSTGDNATPDNPLVVEVYSPNGNPVDIDVDGTGVNISAPNATAERPLIITFRLHESLFGGATADDVIVRRNGTVVPGCTGDPGVADPDPCVASRESEGDELVLTVLTSAASLWELSVPTVVPVTGACPTDQVPASGFLDIGEANVHASAIDCIVWWAIARGTADDSFSPATATSRAQMATFLVALLEQAGVDLPAGEDRFADVSGVHEANIHRLAEAGIVAGRTSTSFGPGDPVTRAQMATFLVRAYELATGETAADTPAGFDDIAGNVHESSINKAVGAGLALGESDTTYAPADDVRRDQMASFLTRLLEALVAQGIIGPKM